MTINGQDVDIIVIEKKTGRFDSDVIATINDNGILVSDKYKVGFYAENPPDLKELDLDNYETESLERYEGNYEEHN